MSKTLKERYIIQPQHLADIHVVRHNSQFVGRISEEKVALSKGVGAEELETLPFPSMSTKQQLKENSLKGSKKTVRAFEGKTHNTRRKIPAQLTETCEKLSENYI